jgi:putative transposase
LNLSRSAFYAWRQAKTTLREDHDQKLLPKVHKIFDKHERRYGTRRIVMDLRDQGIACGRRRVAKLMKYQGLRAIQPKSFKPRSTESRHRLGYSPYLLSETTETTGINQLWVGDITYIPIQDRKFSYLATLLDRYSRRIVSWHLSEDMTEALVLEVLTKAIRTRQPGPSLIHHTDRGGQYAGAAYRRVLKRAAMLQSMSRPDNCYDNAFMESCFGTIKTELEMTEYENHRAAEYELSEYIRYYNLDRKHSALDYLTPAQFEAIHPSPN